MAGFIYTLITNVKNIKKNFFELAQQFFRFAQINQEFYKKNFLKIFKQKLFSQIDCKKKNAKFLK